MTIEQWLSRWVEAHAVGLKPSTAESYRRNTDRYLTPRIGHERVQALSPSRLSLLFRELYERGGHNGRGLSPRTVEFARAVLRKAMDDAVMERLIEVNPVIGTKRPKTVKPHHAVWTPQELRRFLEATQAERLGPLWALAAATGMRRGELLALRWSDVDLDAATIVVQRSVTQVGKTLHYVTTKNNERREVTIDPRTLAVLRAWRRQQVAERLERGETYRDTAELVFTWPDGRPMLGDYVTKQFMRSQAAADVPRITLHEMRHTHASILLREGVPLHVVSNRLGHRDASVTLNTYAHHIPEDSSRTVVAFSRAVWGA